MNRSRTGSFLVLTCLLAGPALATDGYFAHGYGTQNKAMAGAGVALSLNTLAPATNPAGLAFLGKRYDVGIALFNPNREFSVSGLPSGFPGTFGLAPGTVESGSKAFPVPSLGASWRIGENGAFGVALYGNGGMNTDYAAPVFGFEPTGVDLSQMFVAPTYAHRFGRHAVGVSVLGAYQRFEARGLLAFSPLSSDAASLTDNDHANAYGLGARVGYQGELLPWLSLGAAYQTRVAMTDFDEYQGLFAEQGAFDIPQNLTAGVAVKPVEKLTLVFDVQWIDYSSVRSVANDFLPNLAMAPLGMDDGAGFGWHDMTVYKGGVRLQTGESWTWLAGYSYGRQPIRENEVLINILAPGVMEQHVTAGVSRILGKGKMVNFAVTRAIPNTVSGANNLEAPGAQTIDLTMDQWDFDLSFSFGF